MITVREMLELPGMQEAVIRAGRSGLNREIRWVHSIEHEDVGQFLEGGELLFSSGQVWPSQPNTEGLLLESFLENHIAGMVFATGYYLSEIPKHVLEFGKRHGIPVLEVPYRVSFVKMTQLILHRVLNEQETEAALRRNRLELLRFLLEDKAQGSLQVQERVQELGLDPDSHWFIGLVISGKDDVDADMLSWRQICQKWINGESDVSGFCEPYHEQLLLAISCEQEFNYIKATFLSLYDSLVRIHSHQIPVLVMGGVKQHLFKLYESYQDAKKLSPIVQYRNARGDVYFTDEWRREAFLYSSFDPNRARDLRNLILPKELFSERGAPLYETLKCLALHGYNRDGVSRVLHIHRNTLRYRIKRIENILNDNLSSPRCQFWIQMALDLESLAKQP